MELEFDWEYSRKQKALIIVGCVFALLIISYIGYFVWDGGLEPMTADTLDKEAQPEFGEIVLSDTDEQVNKRYDVLIVPTDGENRTTSGVVNYVPGEGAYIAHYSDMSNNSAYLTTYINTSADEPVLYQRKLTESYRNQHFNSNRSGEIATGVTVDETAKCGAESHTYGRTTDAEKINSYSTKFLDKSMFENLKLEETGSGGYTIAEQTNYKVNDSTYLWITHSSGQIRVDDDGVAQTSALRVQALKYKTVGGVFIIPVKSPEVVEYTIRIYSQEDPLQEPEWVNHAEDCFNQPTENTSA